jgi:hypothetical protein
MALIRATASSAARTEVLMFRKLMFVLCAMSLTLASASCGRQVTPNRNGTSGNGPPSGDMMIKFTTSAAMDFGSVWYVIVLNTGGAAPGTNGEPYPIGSQQNWNNYSFEFIVYQLQGQSQPQVALYQFINQLNPGGGSLKVPFGPLNYAPQLVNLTTNCNGQFNQFCLLINRNILAGLSSPTPSPSPSASPTVSPSPSPTSSSSATPSASPTPPTVTGTWFVNWFTVTPNSVGGQPGVASQGVVIDAPGPGDQLNGQTWLPPGAPYDTSTQFDQLWQAVPPPGWTQVTPAAAQIGGGEVLNTP